LRGEGPTTHLPQRPAPQDVPIYVATLSLDAAERAAGYADGIMPTQWSPERVAECRRRLAGGARPAAGAGPVDLTLGIPTFVGDDLDAMRQRARQNLALYTGFPYFRRLYRGLGFGEEAARMAAGAGADALSDRLLDAICLLGPVERCRQRLAEFRDAGVDLPILGPPIGPDAAIELIGAFHREPAAAAGIPAARTPV
jgi:alkanesulfonate monooxygenase SsuD/methylene tetrahydromethanopterin reductase-like flavin-dependent oxidoreductase (luciferase family)